MWRDGLLAALESGIGVTLVIADNDEDVWFLRGAAQRSAAEPEGEDLKNTVSHGHG
jgi:hypothetical protein